MRAEARRIGLCARCTHGRRTVSDRGSVFYRCAYAAIDPAWPKYPPTPVISCRAFSDEGPPVP
jgi:hypothetical protein